MYRSLSLKKNRKEQDSKKDPDYLDLSGDKDISEIKYSQEKTMAETDGENLTQLDLKNTSLSLNFRSGKQVDIKSGKSQKDETTSLLSEIEEQFEKRHHIATLAYTLESAKERHVIPKYVNTNLDFFPFFGSNSAKDYFQEKLKTIRAKVNEYALDEFIKTSEELITIFTSKAEYFRGKLIENLNDSTEEGRQRLSEAQGHILNLIEIWDTKYNDYIKDYDKKISGPKEQAKKPFIAKGKRDGRNFPYKRRN
ncbi:unnamed protein product [Mytilus coruscus]|uniref:Uncharacterized protein n=1 Tax=Mytilus coruscus TaxID=42192 RepID=A0A6J8D983_MYTCO|nr:unnamed protein product [Mytilus coruscus]